MKKLGMEQMQATEAKICRLEFQSQDKPQRWSTLPPTPQSLKPFCQIAEK